MGAFDVQFGLQPGNAQDAGSEKITAGSITFCSSRTSPDALAALLYRHSEGNPLFMVAAMKYLVNEACTASPPHGVAHATYAAARASADDL